jgi:hypothetical protein
MAHIKKRFLCLITLLFFITVSCATTQLTAVWEAPNFKGPIRKIAVVGAFQSQTIRNVFEDEFVKRLSDSGLDAIASYTIVPVEKVEEQEYLMSRISESGADVVLVTRLIDIKTEQTYVRESVYVVPEYYYNWGHYYRYIYSPGYVVNTDYAYAETNIYSVNDQKMIWSAHSRTQISGTNEKLIRSFVETIVDRLSEGSLTAY